MSKQVTFSIKESLEALQKDLAKIAPAAEREINLAVKGIAEAAYAHIVSRAQAELGRTRQDYLNGLTFETLEDGAYLISLDGDWANKTEAGYGSFDLRAAMLASKKTVEVGPRAGQPWVQQSKPRGKNKESHKFANVPFQHQPFSKTSNMGDAIKALQASNASGALQNLTQIFKDDAGNPLEGRVARVDDTGDSSLNGITKIQKIYEKNGKPSVQSIYMTWRRVSEAGKPWISPGRPGVAFFDSAEKEIEKQMDALLKTLT